MITLISRSITTMLAISLFTGCTTITTSSTLENEKIDFIDSRSIKKSFEKQVLSLEKAGKTLPLADLIAQMNKKTCQLKLVKPSTTPLKMTEIYQQSLKSTLLVGGIYKCGKCTKWHASIASGFFLTEDGVFCTNYHVVNNEKLKTIVAMDYTGKVFPIKKVLAANKVDDVAILKIDKANCQPLALTDNTPVGSKACLISHPQDNYYMFTSGMVSRYFTAPVHVAKGKHEKADRMSITADFAGGSSGAAILGENGNAIGMVTATRSVYAHKNKNGHNNRNLQMVIKMCVPTRSILKLIEPQEQ